MATSELSYEAVAETCDVVRIDVCDLSGKSGTVLLSSASLLDEVRSRIEELIAIPAGSQRWVADSEEISFLDVLSLADTKLRDGDRVTVMHDGFARLRPLPKVFDLKLTSARERFHGRYSSAFVIFYKTHADVPAGRWIIEPWRKNDHDRFVYDTKAQTATKQTSHWMAGTNERTSELKDSDPLGDFLSGWHGHVTPVWEESERFWRPACSDGSQDGGPGEDDVFSRGEEEEAQVIPRYSAVPGWFVMPSQGCVEIRVDLPWASKRIIRLLLDAEGRPVRAALNGCKMGGLHEDIEEYDVLLEAA